MLNKKVLPIRDLKMAAVHATIAIALLALIRYPVEEWAVTGAVVYVFFRLSGEVIAALALYVSKSLLRYGERISHKLQAAIPDNRATEGNRAGQVIALVLVLLLQLTTVGLGLGSGGLVVSNIGLTPLPGYFSGIAWGLAGVGLAGAVLIFGLMALTLFAVDNLSAVASPKFDQFQEATRGVDSRLRRGRLMAPPVVG